MGSPFDPQTWNGCFVQAGHYQNAREMASPFISNQSQLKLAPTTTTTKGVSRPLGWAEG